MGIFMGFFSQGYMRWDLIFLFVGIIFFVSSCKEHGDHRDLELAEKFQTFTKEYQLGNPVLYQIKMDSLRSFIDNDDPLIAEYYYQSAKLNVENLAIMKLYADSCFSYYNSKERIGANEQGYLRALMIKAEFFYLSKHYSLALSYFAQGNEIIENGNYPCEAAGFSQNVGNIYYNQKRYSNARLRMKIYLTQLPDCNQTPQNFFFKKQFALNVIGLTYENENKLDSALYFYHKTIQFTDSMGKAASIKERLLIPTIANAYDNIGGVYLKKGKLDSANYYLNKSLQLNKHNPPDIIPPLLKMADLQLQEKKFTEAYKNLLKTDSLLIKYKKSNTDSYRLKWYRLLSKYYFNENKIEESYKYSNLYLINKDSADMSNISLYSFDIDKEFSLLTREKKLSYLTQQDSIKNIYLIAGGIFLIMFLIIILLLFSNLKKNKKRNLNTRLQNNALQKALEKLELTNKNYIRILRVMAHDFKNPLVGISGVAAILTTDEKDPERKELLELIEESSTNAINMINDLLKHGLAEDDANLEKEKVNLHELLDSSIFLLKFNAAKKEQTIDYNIPDDIYVDGNQEKLWRVFNNIIVNAIKFSHIGGLIKVSATVQDQWTIVSIEDNGMGIPLKDKDEVFKMFSPAKKSGTAGEEPFGLGLSISKKILEIHNGELWFEPNPNDGTIFYIKLPLYKD